MKPRLVVGAALSTVATTALVAGAVHLNRVGKLRRDAAHRPDELPPELPPDREYTVFADDGLALSVEELDPVDGGSPELTVVLVHGYLLDRRTWLFQRYELAHFTRPRVRQVLYDLRSHGRSGRSLRGASTIEQLGRDLYAVLSKAAPEGPIVLIGHSMGGMTIMALAEQNPELFAERISGVAFLNTSAGEIGRSGLSRPFLSPRNPIMPVARRLSSWEPSTRAIDRGRNAAGNLAWSLTRKLSFVDESVSPAVVELLYAMINSTSFEVVVDFVATFGLHNRYAALAGLRRAKALVLGTDRDLLLPYQHAEEIAELLTDVELVMVKGAGHLPMLEQPKRVNDHLLEFLSKCAGALH
ncbi:MAG TPA: alpha/beta hydrolase [Pseudonocardiaceae bacterium]|jgi:pimeloyl-ACP methyl ester carboxylesterase